MQDLTSRARRLPFPDRHPRPDPDVVPVRPVQPAGLTDELQTGAMVNTGRPSRRVLILGGTAEAAALGRAVAAMPGISAILSFAGRTRSLAAQALPVRVGGFGGTEGLRRWLRESGTERVIDATHPFAARMAAHVAHACAAEGVPRIKLIRPAWQESAGDLWTHVASLEEAVTAIGPVSRRVFLPLGRGSVAAFAKASFHHYVIRSIELPDDVVMPESATTILARPPFTLEGERALLREAAVDVIVTKNSGGEATMAKLVAARELRLPVIMIARPHLPDGPWFPGLERR